MPGEDVVTNGGLLPLEGLIESVLFVAPEPLEVGALAGLLGAPRDEVERALSRLAEAGAGRGVRVQRQGDVVQLVTAPEAAAVVSRFLSDERQSRLSSAALETLAVVAYRQPVTRAQVERALSRLAEAGAGRGVRVQRQGDVVQLVTAPEAAAVVSRFLSDERQSRLSSAALETLAVVAYRQPVTRAQVEALRGVNSERALGTLQARGLVVEVGRQTSVGRPVLYGTTAEFLEYFGLTSLAELPPADPAEPTLPKERLPRARRNSRKVAAE